MKKILLVIPVILFIIHILNTADAGPLAWTQDLSGSGAIFNNCIAIHPTNSQIMYAGSNTSGVYKSTNGGLNWATSNTGLTQTTLQALAISNSNPSTLYAGTSTSGVFKSTDDGATWTTVNTGITQSPNSIQSICIKPTDPNTVIIAVWDGVAALDASVGLFKTTNGGTSWAAANTGFGANKNVLTVVSNPLQANTVYAGTSFITPGGTQTGPCFVYKSYDFGGSWTNSSTGFGTATTDIDPVRQLSVSTIDTNTVLAGRFFNTLNGGPWLTTNAGASWVQKTGGITPTAPGSLVRSVLIRPGSNTEFFLGGEAAFPPGGVWRTTNAGVLWSSFNSGVMQATYVVRALAFRTSDQTLFAGVAGTSGQGVYDYSFGPLGISGNNGETPKTFNLSQNYPNPFNPSTVIQFAVPKTSLVTIKVYDMSGREVQTLVNETKNTGTYQVNFNASNLASGVYLYKIQAGDFRDTKKMILVK